MPFSKTLRFSLPVRLLAVGLLSCTPEALAGGVSLSRDEAIAFSLKNNREIQLTTFEAQKARSRMHWSGRWENPELAMSLSNDHHGEREGEGSFDVALSQQFPLTARLSKERQLRRYQVVLADAEIAEKKRQIAGEVDRAFVAVLLTKEQALRQRKQVSLKAEKVRFLKKNLPTGQVSLLDVNQAVLEEQILRQEIAGKDAVVVQKMLALKNLLGMEPTQSLSLRGQLQLPAVAPRARTAESHILGQRPDYLLAIARVDEAEAAVILEKSKNWQDATVSVFVQRERVNDEPIGLVRNKIAGVGFSLPLPFRKKNESGRELAQIDREAAGKGVEAVRLRIRTEYEAAFQQRLSAWHVAKRGSGDLIDLANKNLGDIRNAYSQGQASYVQVKDAEEQLLKLQNDQFDSIAAYHTAEAEIRSITGAYPGMKVSTLAKPK